MGFGGMLTWTAAIREVYKHNNLEKKMAKVLPCDYDQYGNYKKTVMDELFLNNPYIYNEDSEQVFYFPLSLQETNYCKEDYPDRAVHRPDKHIIEQICEYHGIVNPELRCDLFFGAGEMEKAEILLENVSADFLVIEPYSNREYTANRSYPFEKWQKVVDSLSGDIEIVQVGIDKKQLLNNVTDLIGKTTFREAACLIGYSEMLLSTESGLVHAATAVDTTALSIVTGYQDPRMVNYPQNINLYIGTHGPCGWKVPCVACREDAERHDESEIIDSVRGYLENEENIH
jgi:ADP-heptose:LPS heptosyltransferase